MKNTLLFVFLFIWISTQGQSIQKYALTNGLTVILDSNDKDRHVYGSIVVNVGSVDEEPNATGMAHYLEHMLFKGTEELGTTDWEKEQVHYNKIIALYDELQDAESEEEIKAINKKINDETIKQSQYIISNEFSAAIQQMGGKGLNASTSHERTDYFNSFPTNQLEKWLSIYSHRLSNPVFRLFQTELETVYEEKNRSSDNPFIDYAYKVREIVYGEDSPYARPIIGETDHLKKPWLSAMIRFYEKWYVPNNMALILSGKFNPEEVKPLIEQYFGKFERKALPNREVKKVRVPSKKIKEKVKLTPYLVGVKDYIIPFDTEFKEDVTVELIGNLLSNSFETGFLDKLRIDGDVISASAYYEETKAGKLLEVQYIPKFDINQFRQESLGFSEKMVDEAIEKIKNGDFKEIDLENIKTSVAQQFERFLETPSSRVNLYTYLFVLGKDLSYINNYIKELKTIDKDFVSKTAKKYLTTNHISIHGEVGKSKVKDDIEKPELDPVKFTSTSRSPFLDKWMKSQEEKAAFSLFDPQEIRVSEFQDKVDLHYLENKNNDLFRLIIRFEAGKLNYSKLGYATSLLNNSGVLGQYTSDELRKAFGNLNVAYSFSSSNNDTFIFMEGYDEKLGEACQLLSRLMLIPEITEKSLDGIIGRELNQRSIEDQSISTIQNALFMNMAYGEKSDYIDRLSNSDVISISPSELSGVFNEAISHKAHIYYYGKLKEANLKNVLSKNLAFGSNRKDGLPVKRKKLREYDKNTIFVVNEPKARQAHIYIFMESDQIKLDDIPKIEAFNQYFSGGFNGLFLKEIRENRALAYTAGTSLAVPLKREWSSLISGYVGTQADKTAEALEVIVDLLNNMPEYPERMEGIKHYLLNGSEVGFENKGGYLLASKDWKEMGYKGNPLAEKLPAYEKLTFDDVKKVYLDFIKGNKYSIGIVGKTSDMDMDSIKKLGKVVKVNKSKLFSDD